MMFSTNQHKRLRKMYLFLFHVRTEVNRSTSCVQGYVCTCSRTVRHQDHKEMILSLCDSELRHLYLKRNTDAGAIVFKNALHEILILDL